MQIRRNRCVLCGVELYESHVGSLSHPNVQIHPEADDCLVTHADAWGIPIELDDLKAEVQATGQAVGISTEDNEPDLYISTFPLVDTVLKTIFESRGLTYLGGASSGKGWSSFSKWQRCAYLWKKSYLDTRTSSGPVSGGYDPPARAIGSLLHVFLALKYANMIDNHPYQALTPTEVYARAVASANPELVQEAWRVFTAYQLHYKFDYLIPIWDGVERDIKDPRTGESARFDLIAFVEKPVYDLEAGTYIIEHKSGARFDNDFLNSWQNDGEVIGQAMLWKRLGFDKRFGPLKGTIMNLLGKQKEPRFHRTFVSPDAWRIKSHERDLKRHEGLLQLAISKDDFPRSRGNCISRFGRCDLYEHCAGSDD